MSYEVLVTSDEYGGEEYGEYNTLPEAYQAIARLAKSAAKLDDGIFREYIPHKSTKETEEET